jgi:competence protein ComGC
MKKINSSGSSLFLMEIILNILIFSILLTVCLQFFLKARQLTGDTTQLERAVTCCSNAANVYESGDGTLDSFSGIYTDAIVTVDQVIVYLDENFIECPAEDSVYTMQILPAESENASVSVISITCYDGSEEIYSIRACSYAPLSPNSQGGDSDA